MLKFSGILPTLFPYHIRNSFYSSDDICQELYLDMYTVSNTTDNVLTALLYPLLLLLLLLL